MDDYIAKPVRSKELFATLRRLLAGKSDEVAQTAEPAREGDRLLAVAPAEAAREETSAAEPQATSPVAGNGETQAVDWNKALRSVGGDKQLLREVIAAFFSESPKLLDQIRHGLDSNDLSGVQRAAHTLKGALRTLGCGDAAEAAWQLEMSSPELGPYDGFQLLERLERSLQSIQAPLVAFTRGDDMLEASS